MESKQQKSPSVFEILEDKISLWELDRDNEEREHKSKINDLIKRIKNIKKNGGCAKKED